MDKKELDKLIKKAQKQYARLMDRLTDAEARIKHLVRKRFKK